MDGCGATLRAAPDGGSHNKLTIVYNSTRPSSICGTILIEHRQHCLSRS